jgi:4-hydroxybenzoate polyprenyltransferase
LAPRRSVGGLIRLVHPFPILLDGSATSAVALLAGADPAIAVRLGLAMLALQASIGALNDLVDAPFDAGRKPGKPIPAGLVSPALARAIVVGAAGLGLALAAPSGPGLVAVSGSILVIGYGYDLVAKGTAWSWLPFAIGIPLLPVFGWFGAVGTLPSLFAVLLPAAVMAGAALAIANSRADMDRDEAAGLASVAIRLGARRAWAVGSWLLAIVVVVALGSLWLRDAPTLAVAATFGAVLPLGAGVVLGRTASATRRERAWELQAIGVALLAAAWLWGVGPPG